MNQIHEANRAHWDAAADGWRKLRDEDRARDARFWEDASYLPGADASLLDWRSNPRAGLPVWLTVAAQKPRPAQTRRRRV